MPVPLLFYVCVFASAITTDLMATTITIDNDHIAVIIPVTTKDRSFTVNVFREKDTDFAITEDDAFDQEPVIDLDKQNDEKKTAEQEKPIK